MRQGIRNALFNPTFPTGEWRLLQKAKQAHTLHKQLSVHFSYSPLTEEKIATNGLVLTRISPNTEEMIAAMLIYRFANVIRSALDSKYIYYGVKTELIQEVLTSLKAGIDPLIEWWADTEALRNDFRARLTELKLKPGAAVKRLEAQERTDPLKDILILPVTVNTSHYVWLTDEALCNLTLSKIAYDRKAGGLWERLSVCARSDCRVFFIRKQLKGTPGGPPQRYCDPECMKIVNQRDATERKRRSRAARKSK